jgi:hypothetical protein
LGNGFPSLGNDFPISEKGFHGLGNVFPISGKLFVIQGNLLVILGNDSAHPVCWEMIESKKYF